MVDLKDKVVLIAGDATGIATYVIRILMEEGVKHAALVDVAEAEGKAFQNEMSSKYGDNKMKFFKGDVDNEEHLFEAYDETVKAHGYIDIVINNAGILSESEEIQINMNALVSSTHKALRLMQKDQGGKGGIVINITSLSALLRIPSNPMHAAVEAAALTFSNSIGHEDNYAKTGVKVITVAFGVINTSRPVDPLRLLGYFMYLTFIGIILSSLKQSGLPCSSRLFAAAGVIDACKKGETGSTWLVNEGQIKDVTSSVKQAYNLLSTLAQ